MGVLTGFAQWLRPGDPSTEDSVSGTVNTGKLAGRHRSTRGHTLVSQDEFELAQIVEEEGDLGIRDDDSLSQHYEGSMRGKGAQARWQKRVINPRSDFMRRWDVILLMLLIFTASVTPFEISFLVTKINAMYFINRFVDLLFLIDIILNFYTGYWDEELDHWVMDLGQIRRRYLSSWFLIDVISILPFDTVGYLFRNQVIGKLKIFRIARMFRLAKLLRILRAGRILRRWESSMSINYSSLHLVRFTIVVLTLAHWMACVFHLIITLENTHENWLAKFNEGYPGYEALKPMQMYTVCIYWSIMTMSTIGYGDVLPFTHWERAYTTFGMLVGASIYAYVVGSVCNIVQSMDAEQTEFYRIMDNLNSFMAAKRLPKGLRMRLREFFRYRRSNGNVDDTHALLAKMSPSLRADVAIETHSVWMRNVSFFQGCPKDFVAEVTLALRSESFSPHEFVIREGDPGAKMLIVERGILIHKGFLYTAGMVLGSTTFLSDDCWHHSVSTLTYAAVNMLWWVHLESIMEHYPGLRAKIRKYVIMERLREGVVLYTKLLKRARENSLSTHMSRDLLQQEALRRMPLTLLLEVQPNAAEESRLVRAAVRIQRTFRGYMVRRRVAIVRQLLAFGGRMDTALSARDWLLLTTRSQAARADLSKSMRLAHELQKADLGELFHPKACAHESCHSDYLLRQISSRSCHSSPSSAQRSRQDAAADFGSRVTPPPMKATEGPPAFTPSSSLPPTPCRVAPSPRDGDRHSAIAQHGAWVDEGVAGESSGAAAVLAAVHQMQSLVARFEAGLSRVHERLDALEARNAGVPGKATSLL
eukprot:jgi/Mesvir1/19168/Mv01189-RA.1